MSGLTGRRGEWLHPVRVVGRLDRWFAAGIAKGLEAVHQNCTLALWHAADEAHDLSASSPGNLCDDGRAGTAEVECNFAAGDGTGLPIHQALTSRSIIRVTDGGLASW